MKNPHPNPNPTLTLTLALVNTCAPPAVVDEGSQREVFVATGLYREGITLSGWIFNRYDEYVQMKLGGSGSSSQDKNKNLFPFHLDRTEEAGEKSILLSDKYHRYFHPIGDFGGEDWYFYAQFLFPIKTLNANIYIASLATILWKFHVLYLIPVLLDLCAYGVFRWYQLVLILVPFGFTYKLWIDLD